MIYKNIFLTGERNCGKSTLINNILSEIKLEYRGYKTLPYYIDNDEMGYYLRGLFKDENLKGVISVKVKENKVVPIIDTFDFMGTYILRKSIEDKNSNIIILDEIGFLENKSEKFKNEIHNCLSSKKFVLGVLKKKDTEFLNGIKDRQDTLVINIENISYDDRDILKEELVRLLKDKNN